MLNPVKSLQINMFHYVYVLLSEKDKGFCGGYTKDLQGRFETRTKECSYTIASNRI